VEIDRVVNRDCLAGMRELEENSVDAIVTDPPYGISMMGKDWDKGVPGIPYWQEALRVAKPGAHLLACGGTRTHHRLMIAIEDAGWEIRDCLMWVHGGALPKSLDVGKAIDKAAGAERKVVGVKKGMGKQNPDWNGTSKGRKENSFKPEYLVTAPATEAAKQWDGWGTALKPAYEPVILARKPLDGTVAGTVLKWGCGGINIDGCRIDSFAPGEFERLRKRGETPRQDFTGGRLHSGAEYTPKIIPSKMKEAGRWPANLLLDEAAADLLDQQSGTLKSGANPARSGSAKFKTCYGEFKGQESCTVHRGANSGGVSRFFYCSKASKNERCGSLHPTVKPLDLMRYLCRLVTPPGGLILDPFLGSGTTAVAAVHEGFHYLGFEINPTYCADAERRIAEARQEIAAPRPNKRGNSASKDAPQATTLAAFGTEET
jgi:site-specific DNA-methyltransferase (adenine-specific)